MIGNRVRDERERAGLTQVELAKLAGLNWTTVWGVEGGNGNPRIGTLVSIASALGLRVEDLLMAGPALLDLAFALPSGVDLGPISTLEMRIAGAVAEAVPDIPLGRIGIWPWCGPVPGHGVVVTSDSSSICLRAPASLAPQLLSLAGRPLLLGPGVTVAAPVVRPVGPAATLQVLIKAPSPDRVEVRVRKEATAAGCCPAVKITRKRPLGPGSAWLATVRGVPPQASAFLQRLRVSGPDGLFVPA
jgi:HTH-type transcriptional regulator/antitoxin HipB